MIDLNTPLAAPPVSMRPLGDPVAARQAVFDSVLTAAKNLEPVKNSRYTLQLSDVDYEPRNEFSPLDEKKAILRKGTLARRLYGTWNLVDNATGAPVGSRKTTIANVPYFTDRGTFIYRGVDYTLANQTRLLPGAYTRIKDNGELSSHINVMPGQGVSHHIAMDPKTGVFNIEIAKTSVPLLSVLRAMGAKDQQIREAWGNELYAQNNGKANPADIDKLYRKLFNTRGVLQEPDKAAKIAEKLRAMTLDREVNRRTLGKEYDHVDVDQILDTTKKLLRVSRMEEDPDDRDRPAYMRVYGLEDLLAERVARNKATLNKILWKATNKNSVDAVPASLFDDHLYGAILTSGLGIPSESVNPAQIFEQMYRTTRMGVGGIPSADSIPDSARDVQPSYLGFIDPVISPESANIGVDSRFVSKAMKGSDGRVYVPLIDNNGNTVYRSPQDVADVPIATADAIRENTKFVRAVVNNKATIVPRDEVKYVLPHMEYGFSAVTNMVPMKSAMRGQRSSMAARMLTQALPLVEPEAPLVQSGVPDEDDKSFEELYGEQMGAKKSPAAGVVVKTDGGQIVIRGDDGRQHKVNYYEHLPHNTKTGLHSQALVKTGDRVSAGDLLTVSNYTDKKGTAALGRNARVAFIPYGGGNFEDAYVVSESFAKRLNSEHYYQTAKDFAKTGKRGKLTFASIFPTKYQKAQLNKLDEDGVVRVGQTVTAGDPLVLFADERSPDRTRVHRARQRSFVDASETWEHHADGIVTDVEKTPTGAIVVVKSTATAQVGDKISGRHGNKGVLGKIIPDEQMPHDEQGVPYDILANPYGTISRGNPAQNIEAMLGKVAALTGKPVKLRDFDDIEDLQQFASDLLKKHGLKSKETIVDPITGRRINNVGTGNIYVLKLHHLAESKGQGRSVASYTSEGLPAKGGSEGSKRVGLLNMHAILSHGATGVAQDVVGLRGQKQDQILQQFMSGYRTPNPEVPFVYRKFVDSLRGAGINVVRQGARTHIMALRDNDIDQLAGDREIKEAATLDWRSNDLKPVRGGLFDENLTGGLKGNRWSYISLPEPMPNPVMEEPIRRVLGLTKQQFTDVLAGRTELFGKRGPSAIHEALAGINLDSAIEQARRDIDSGRKTYRDNAVRKLRYLKSAKRLGIHPKEWVLSKVPVIPPAFRPASLAQFGARKPEPLIADANYLYKEVLDAKKAYLGAKDVFEDVADERENLYKSFKAVTGLGDPTSPKNVERRVKGLIAQVTGPSPKFSMMQYKLLSRPVDMVGRAVIVPNSDLDMDEVGIPENKAWDVYKVHLVRRLVRDGVPQVQAAKEVAARSERAKRALLEEIDSRPVIIDRAPVWHRYGVMAFWPKLVKGDSMHINPFITTGANADFDGDAMQYHVPFSDEAVKDAVEKMMPSKNLLSVNAFEAHQLPSKEFLGGLYSASRLNKKKKPMVFRTKKDVLAAIANHEIAVDQPVQILEER